jgi:hypothetical protein
MFQFWLRDTLKVFIQYLAVAFSSIPAVVIYFLCLRIYPNPNIGMIAALCAGFSCAFYSWHLIDKTILLPHPATLAERQAISTLPANAGAFSDLNVLGGNLRFSTTLAVSILVLPSIQPPMTLRHSDSCQQAMANIAVLPKDAGNNVSA